MNYQVYKRHGENLMHITERSQSVKVKCYLIPSIGHPGKCKNMETLKHQWLPEFQGEGPRREGRSTEDF